ncbi:cytochrome-c peroxidase [Chondromyces crocatus]|uniref:Cytochrome C peroxidase n=1 Tax=Chondromyces crocatus TaxID=52 RepID=A0A0K1ECK7_CHOCO|nr:cytochrome c peroxidase [Chondromyces crocatus]AKT38600.1 cytochrome C peroxidase [Chondromyces crocatus]
MGVMDGVSGRLGRRGGWSRGGVVIAAVLLGGCGDDDGTTPLQGGPDLDQELAGVLSTQEVRPVVPPAAQDPRLVELGRNLFFEKEISGRRNISCGTCHHPLLGSADGQSQSRGQGAVGLGPARRHVDGSIFLPRNTLSVWNRGVAGWDTMFWDGRLSGNLTDGYVSPAGDATPQDFSSALAAFSIIPVTPDEEMRGFPGEPDVFGNPNEMADLTNDDFAQIWPLVVARAMGVEKYRAELLALFPGTAEADISIVHLGEALGAFMIDAFTMLDTPFDRYLAGNTDALSDAAKRGALLFYGRASCSSCHSGALQTDFGFHNVAAPQVGTGKGDEAPFDHGLGRVTGVQSDRFKFRTPSLRNIELEGPWMHNGAYASLEDTVRHHLDPVAALSAYDDRQVEPELQGTYQQNSEELLSTLAPELAVKGDPLKDEEVADLMAFLSALTDPRSLNLMHLIPDSVPSGLPVAD